MVALRFRDKVTLKSGNSWIFFLFEELGKGDGVREGSGWGQFQTEGFGIKGDGVIELGI